MSGDCVGTVLVGGMSGDCVETVLVVGGCLVTVWELSWWWWGGWSV